MKSSSAYTGKPMSLSVSQQLNEPLPVQQDPVSEPLATVH